MHEEDVAPGVGGYRGRRVVLQQHALTQFADATCAVGFRSADHRRSRRPPTFPGALNPLGANCGVIGCTRMYGPVELPLAIDRRKQLRVVGDALRCGQEQHPVWLEGVVKNWNQPFLQFRLEIDHQVAAREQVELGEGRVLDDVMYCEHHFFANLPPDDVTPVVAAFLAEKSAQARRGHALDDVVEGVAADPRHGYGVIVEVGGVDLEMQSLLLPLVHQLQEHHGNRIGFLAGGATGHPDPECVATESARQQRR